MPGESPLYDTVKTDIANKTTPSQSINVDKIPGRTCYFSLTGNLALKAFEEIRFSTFTKDVKRKRLKQELKERLFFAVLMFDTIVLHCSDPLRNELVLETLEENEFLITKGKIVFLFSNHIKNIKEDYRIYIDRKIKEYSDGFHSQNEADSLKQPHMNEEYYKRVISILEKSVFMVRKSKDKSYDFDKLVLNDISNPKQHEQIVIDSSLELSKILSLCLSLEQLLHVRIWIRNPEDTTGKCDFLFPQNIIEDVIDEIEEHLTQRNTISRSAIVDVIKEALKEKPTKKQKNVLKAIALRMDVLYCKMNSGNQLVLEFHPNYEPRSIYQLNCFKEYLKLISHNDKEIILTSETINDILECEKLYKFRMCFISSMADMHEYMNLSQTDLADDDNEYLNIFVDILTKNGVSELIDFIKF